MQLSAFVQAPFPPRSRHTRPSTCMLLRANRYNPSFGRSPTPPPSTPSPPPPHALHPGVHTGNGTPLSFSNAPPPPPPPPPLDDRPDRDDSTNESSPPIAQETFRLSRWGPLHSRLTANPRLPLQLAVELTVGFVSKTLAEVQDRGQRFWREFDHYLSNLSLELFGDAMLVWLLSPVAGAVSALPKHFLQVGPFTWRQRALGFAWKGTQFAVVGVLSSAVGQTVTRALVKASGKDVGELPDVLPNCVAWGGFLALSANLRYQLVNGFEQRTLEKVLPGGVLGAGVTFVLRFGNCYLGGVQWLPWARFLGVQ